MTEIDVVRLFMYCVVIFKQVGVSYVKEVVMAKVYVSEMVMCVMY